MVLQKNITRLHLRMRELVIAAGVSETEYDKPLHMLPNLTPEQLGEIDGWLRGLEVGAYADVVRIWQERDPKYWADLEAFGETNFPEQKILRSARKSLRDAWRKKNGKPKKPDAVPDESEATPG